MPFSESLLGPLETEVGRPRGCKDAVNVRRVSASRSGAVGLEMPS